MLAWVRDESPAARISEILQEAEAGSFHLWMSWINVGEVYDLLSRKHDSKLLSNS